MLTDSESRLQATDPTRSFIVQAPAGSGKTEILTQRYLRLLSQVSAPEQIVALTFTRKAASEMRARVLLALNEADRGLPATSSHKQLTQDYARRALARCKAMDWQLLKQPGRLKIITIDSLCQTLTQAIPFHEQQIPYADITDNPRPLYQEAVRSCLSDACTNASLQPLLAQLLQHLDNRQDTLHQLLTELLTTREQWLTPLYTAKTQTRAACEQALKDIEQQALHRFRQYIPLDCLEELRYLSWHAACIEDNPISPRYHLCRWQNAEAFDREIGLSLAALLLTKDDKFRKSFDHHVGVKRDACPKALYDRVKTGSKALLSALDEIPDCLQALVRIKNLPQPYYDNAQWDVLQALLTLLPLLTAHLQLAFSKTHTVDFSAVAQHALFALGDDDSPTDLALYLDNAIHHLLVDEFQDTSIQQFHLLSRMVQGWLPDEGKTLFIVGDPMQSIYRFRQAEVGLFLKAQQQGIGPVSLTPLQLQNNFRSTATLVDWVNAQFKTIFPVHNDVDSGAVSFHSSTATIPTASASAVYAHEYPNKQQEAEAIAATVISELENHPDADIALLVRSRHQLARIIPLLRKKNIPFQGVEIEKLSGMPHLMDTWSLTKALLLPADRLSWLAMLRSPWCGLTLADIHRIANFDKKKSIYFALSQLEAIPDLSHEGFTRARFFYHIMHAALASRHQQALADWVSGVIKQLHGEQCLDGLQRHDLEQFFVLLNRHACEGQLTDFQQFESEFQRLYSQRVNHARLQIMTIHKSKGLEFDCVILPGLGSKSPQQNKPLLRWLKLPGVYKEERLLLSPLHPMHQKKCPLYDYLGEMAAEREAYEQQRLLYVAVTRAKKRLYLFDSQEQIRQGTLRDLLRLQDFSTETPLSEKEEVSTNKLPLLTRLPLHFYTNKARVFTPSNALQQTAIPANTPTRLTGIVAHELLQWIGDNHPEELSNLPWKMIENRFKGLGFSADLAKQSKALLQTQIERFFLSPIGQWLCKKHQEEHNEYELLTVENGQLVTRIIDRTFYDQGYQWVIDFKTGSDESAAEEAHRQQVNGYARLLAAIRKHPLRCGLFYLATNRWVNWHYDEKLATLKD